LSFARKRDLKQSVNPHVVHQFWNKSKGATPRLAT
jgi:hypothetical protein